MKTDCFLVKNPTSRGGKGKKNWPFFSEYDGVVTSSRDDAINQILTTDKKIIVAVGGDGTINQCVNGIMRSNSDKSLGVLYSGTSPDFCRFHDIPYTPKEALQTLERGEVTNVDVCKIETADNDVYYFSSSCNIGLGVKVASCANKIRKYFGDFLGTFIGLCCALLSAKSFDAVVVINGQKHELKNLYHIFILKNKYIASGLKIAGDYKVDDGLIRIIPLFKKGIVDLIKTVISSYKEGFCSEDLFECTSVTLETIPKQYIEFDGDDYQITTPLKVECLSKVLRLVK